MKPQYHRTKTAWHRRGTGGGHGWVHTHVLIAEKALGKPLPPKAHVHHVDGDHMNNAPSNLVICQDMAYHKLLHYRTRIVKAGGNPNTQKFCNDCKALKDLIEFNVSRYQKSVGRQPVCRACQKKRFADWRLRQLHPAGSAA